METHENYEYTRQDVERLLQAEKPDTDFSSDSALFGQIVDDYADYARLLTAEINAGKAEQQAIDALKETFPAEELERAVDHLRGTAAEMLQGRLTAEMVHSALKALQYDADVAAAEVRGRNAKLDELAAQRQAASDGVPRLGGGGASREPSLFAIARG